MYQGINPLEVIASVSVGLLIIYLLIFGFSCFIFYLIIKTAVKNAIKEYDNEKNLSIESVTKQPKHYANEINLFGEDGE